MRELTARAWFVLCLTAGRLLRSTRYSTTRIVHQDGERQVRKRRRFYAPLLIWMSGPLVRILDTGVRVLPQREWEERERRIYESLRGTSIRVDADNVLVLPVLPGHTLATLLEDPALEESRRTKAIERAVVALAEFHRLELTHGDAMAENVLIDLEAGPREAGTAHWFDFETIHDSSRPIAWRRADDVRALLVTCLVRTVGEKRAETLQFILDVYADEDVTRILATTFASVWRRSLTFHLAQAGLSFQWFREIGRLLRERSTGSQEQRRVGGRAGPRAPPRLQSRSSLMAALSSGASLGPYTIVAPLGAGGMGEVYRAMDTRLKRQVAIKVLPSMLAADPERLGRFQREAEVLASLNHPHIAALYGFEEANGVKALVMELVDGATVADRIAQGPIPIDEALPIARQIAEALEAAHERGIIHRDLKPANIKVRDDGKVKVLDFGLAKLTEASGANAIGGDDVSQAATVMSPAMMTGMGMILGTAAYMSPEQARGKAVDKRTDVWAFGAVLYEMLSATRAFAGHDIADTIASVMKTTPDWTALPADVPPHVVTLIQRCLDKDRNTRISDIAVARFLLSENASLSGISRVAGVSANTISASSAATPSLTSGALPTAALPPAVKGRPWRLLVPLLIAAVVAGGAIGWLLPRRSTVAAPITSLQMNLRPAGQLVESGGAPRPGRTAMALSPDGRLVVFAALKGESTQLYARALDRAEGTAIAGTEGGEEPFFSPDGAWIGFRAANRIKKVPAAGGASAVVCDLSPGMRGSGGSWAEDDAIYFSGSDGIFTVPAAGGTPARVAEPVGSTGERLLLPHVLPGGKAILFTTVVSDLWDAARIVVQPLDAGTPADAPRRDLITGGADARYVDSGHLVYMKSGTLMAVPFDVASQQVSGAPVALIENVMQAVNAPNFGDETGAGQFAVSTSGTLLYALGGIGPIRQSSLVWVDRTGAVTPLATVPPAPQLQPRLSPDGRKLAVDVRRGASRVTDVWVFDVARGAPTRVTLAMESHGAVWSPDSRRVAFVSSASGVGNKVFVANADGSGQPERLTDIPGNQMASTWAATGNAIAFLNRAPGSPLGIWVLPMDGTPRTPKKFLEPGVNLSDPELSPDATWMAYVSNESGPPEVYVQPYPGPGEKIRISTNIGYEPIWTRSGGEILYRSSTPDGERHFYAVAIRSLSPFRFDPPRLMFKAKPGAFDSTSPIRGWDATADGQRFLMNTPIPSTETPVTEMHVVLNWTDELKRRVPMK